MSRRVDVMVLTEGKTEQLFIKRLLAPYMGYRGVDLTPTQLNKPGQKGGDVRFVRAKRDIARYLKQRSDTYVSLMVDYYGIDRHWPGRKEAQVRKSPQEIASTICTATLNAIGAEPDLADYQPNRRFLPHISVHEFEALLFSEPATLAGAIQVDQKHIDAIVQKFGEPEAIDNSPQTAPSKRIEKFYSGFKKTATGIEVAEKIGIEKMRSMCPVFDCWLVRLESLVGNENGRSV